MSLLSLENLAIRYPGTDGTVHAVQEVSLQLAAGGTLGLVGESGSGKSQTALAVLGLLERNAQVTGRIVFDGQDLLGQPARILQKLRGAHIGMVFQDPMTSLNPHLRIGTQLAEVLIQHRALSQAQALQQSARMLDAVRLPDVASTLGKYPHELSGGQRQRVMIAMALLCQPQLLLCDEPTTALDVTVQAQILDLLQELRRDLNLALLLISHDLGLVGELCERVAVMYAGRVVEEGPSARLLAAPRHPYTQALLASRPSLGASRHAPLAVIPGAPPDARRPAAGCAFAPRCPQRLPVCQSQAPPLSTQGGMSRYCHASL